MSGEHPIVAEFLKEEKEAADGPYARWYKTQLAEMEAAEAQMRATGEDGQRIVADDDDDDEDEVEEEEVEEEELRGARKRKKAKEGTWKMEMQAKAGGRGGQLDASMNGGDDVVEELQMEDLDDDDF